MMESSLCRCLCRLIYPIIGCQNYCLYVFKGIIVQTLKGLFRVLCYYIVIPAAVAACVFLHFSDIWLNLINRPERIIACEFVRNGFTVDNRVSVRIGEYIFNFKIIWLCGIAYSTPYFPLKVIIVINVKTRRHTSPAAVPRRIGIDFIQTSLRRRCDPCRCIYSYGNTVRMF